MLKVSVKLSIIELHVLSFSLLVLQRVEFIREFQRRHTCCTKHGHLICFVKHVTVILEQTYIRRVSSHFVPSHFVPSYSHLVAKK